MDHILFCILYGHLTFELILKILGRDSPECLIMLLVNKSMLHWRFLALFHHFGVKKTSLFTSESLCIRVPVGVYNYSDMQGDSPKSRKRQWRIRRKWVKRRDRGMGRQAGDRFEDKGWKKWWPKSCCTQVWNVTYFTVCCRDLENP